MDNILIYVLFLSELKGRVEATSEYIKTHTYPDSGLLLKMLGEEDEIEVEEHE